MPSMEPLFYTVADTARILKCSRSEAYSLIYEGVIPSLRIRSMIRVPAAALHALACKAMPKGDSGDEQ